MYRSNRVQTRDLLLDYDSALFLPPSVHYQYVRNNIIFARFENFPETGEQEKLYFDLDDKILYYWNVDEYIPINTLLIPNTILDGGEAQ